MTLNHTKVRAHWISITVFLYTLMIAGIIYLAVYWSDLKKYELLQPVLYIVLVVMIAAAVQTAMIVSWIRNRNM